MLKTIRRIFYQIMRVIRDQLMYHHSSMSNIRKIRLLNKVIMGVDIIEQRFGMNYVPDLHKHL